MNPDPLDPKLVAYASQPLPSCPPDLTAEVWREIERRRTRSFWSRVLPAMEWRELFVEPRLAGTAIACALVVGMLPAFVISKTRQQQQLARQSIHFEVFSPRVVGQLAMAEAKPSSHSLRP